jgi:hypothetical protein
MSKCPETTEPKETERAKIARALLVNATLVRAYMTREGLQDSGVPDVAWFSQTEAVAASVMMRDTEIGRRKNPDGSTTMTCFVEPTLVRSLYAWALSEWADRGAGKGTNDHANPD